MNKVHLSFILAEIIFRLNLLEIKIYEDSFCIIIPTNMIAYERRFTVLGKTLPILTYVYLG